MLSQLLKNISSDPYVLTDDGILPVQQFENCLSLNLGPDLSIFVKDKEAHIYASGVLIGTFNGSITPTLSHTSNDEVL